MCKEVDGLCLKLHNCTPGLVRTSAESTPYKGATSPIPLEPLLLLLLLLLLLHVCILKYASCNTQLHLKVLPVRKKCVLHITTMFVILPQLSLILSLTSFTYSLQVLLLHLITLHDSHTNTHTLGTTPLEERWACCKGM